MGDSIEDSPIVKSMRKHGIPVTRENYIRENWTPDIMPDPWTVEDEAELPDELQDYALFPELDPNG